ncbi:MAG: GAF domain-containing protein [Cyanobacteriota bacterium]|nr:GAF domain-containing protein [Cyanobacteriota bacterium]
MLNLSGNRDLSTEEALRRSEELNRRILESSPFCIKVLDLEGRICSVSDIGLILMELEDLAPCLGSIWMDWWQGEDREAAYAAAAAAKAGGVGRFTGFCPTAKGTPKWWENLITALRNSEGELEGLLCCSRDITEVWKLEADLRMAQQVAHVGSWSFDPQTLALAWSDEQYRIFGQDPKQYHPAFPEVLDRYHPDDQMRVRQTLELYVTTGESFQIDCRIVRPNGEIRFIEIRGEAGTIRGHLKHLFGTVQDITERKQIERALQQQTEQEKLLGSLVERIRQSLDLQVILTTTVTEVRQLLQADRVLIYQFDKDWVGTVIVESVSDPIFSILGREIQDTCLQNEWHHSYQAGRVSSINDIYDSSIQPCHMELLISLDVRANLVVPIRQDNILWGLLIAHHCTAPHRWDPWDKEFLKRLADQLAITLQQSRLYEQVKALNNQLEMRVEQRTQQLQQSLAFEALLKRITDKVRDSLDENESLQTAVEELGHALQCFCCEIALYDVEAGTAIATHEYTDGTFPSSLHHIYALDSYPEYTLPLLEGEWVHCCDLYCRQQPLTVLFCPMQDEQGIPGDISVYRPKEEFFSEAEIRLVQQVANQCAIALRQARLFEASQQQVRELEELNQLKDDFLSTVSHELRSPLATMRMSIEMLKKSPLNEKQQRYLAILEQQCKYEANLINDLLSLQRLEAHAHMITPECLNITDFLEHLLQPFHIRTQESQLQLRCDIQESLPPFCTDRASLERILEELLNNACKYTEPTGQIILRVGTFLSNSGYGIQFSVSNQASIDPNNLPKLFDKFYRIPQADRWQRGGTGLGLSLIKGLVEELAGEITVTSQQGWTNFRVDIPQWQET